MRILILLPGFFTFLGSASLAVAHAAEPEIETVAVEAPFNPIGAPEVYRFLGRMPLDAPGDTLDSAEIEPSDQVIPERWLATPYNFVLKGNAAAPAVQLGTELTDPDAPEAPVSTSRSPASATLAPPAVNPAPTSADAAPVPRSIPSRSFGPDPRFPTHEWSSDTDPRPFSFHWDGWTIYKR